MKDKVFVDTNVYIYFLLDDEKNLNKNQKAQNIIKQFSNKEIIISVQVLNEIYNTFLKYKIKEDIIHQKLELIISKTKLIDTNLSTLNKCWQIRSKYNYSYWDSLIIASAFQSDCDILFTEDLQNNHIIEGKLKIINPFK